MDMRLAIVGGGPTAVYTLAALVERPLGAPLVIDLFEREGVAGPGMPYREGVNGPQMLSNIASREIPPLRETLYDWLCGLDRDQRSGLGLSAEDIHEEAYYPRLVLGAYYTAQLSEIVAHGRALGHTIELWTRHRVTDVVPVTAGIEVVVAGPEGTRNSRYDHVVIATGHDWPDQTDANGVTFVSPWPARKLRALQNRAVGVLGSSLSGIDVAVALARLHGQFRRDTGGLVWEPSGDAEGFRIALMSRNGLLPEADYPYPLPLPEVPPFTEAAVETERRRGREGLLDRAFALFRDGLAACDPDRAAAIGLDRLTVETFAAAHFAERRDVPAFDWAAMNLAEARRDRRRNRTAPWRIALLRAHEVWETLTPHLSDADLDRFERGLKAVFADGYASVPHRSIERLLALHHADRLQVLAIGGSARFERAGDGVAVVTDETSHRFDALVDARGQRAMTLAQLGFPSLARKGQAQVDRTSFVLRLAAPTTGTIQCLALPVLLRHRPFVQGLVNAQEMGAAAASRLIADLAATATSGKAA